MDGASAVAGRRVLNPGRAADRFVAGLSCIG